MGGNVPNLTPTCMDINYAEDIAAVGTKEGLLYIVELKTPQLMKKPLKFEGKITAIKYSKGFEFLAIGLDSG